jgi:non-specific protein-tyrosine kinase
MSKLRKALRRAKEEKSGSSLQKNDGHVKRLPMRNKKELSLKVPQERNEIKVKYTKTRVEKISRDILKENKILSIFKDNKIANQIDVLRTQILSKLDEINGNSIMVTSAHPGEGKTFTAINLGVSISQQLDRTVLIIDTDLRNPWKNHYDFSYDFWGIRTEKGLTDYLLGNAEIEDLLINPNIEKLTILPAGKPIENSAEMLGSQRMEQLVKEIKKRYGSNRICIFDCPAILPYTDPLVITHLIDGILLVVEAEKTTPNDLKKTIKLLEGKTILGTVYNKSSEKMRKDYK